MRILSASPEALLCFLVSLLLSASFCHGSSDDQTTTTSLFVVVGTGECADCSETNFKTSQAVSGLRVTIDCKPENGVFKTRGSGKLDEEGKFTVSLPQEIVEDGKLKEECYAQLHSASAAPCPAHDGLESSKIVFKTKTNGKHTFGLAGKLKFSPVTCTSAFLWPHYKYPPKPPLSKKPFPPKVLPPPVPYKPLPPPVPVVKPLPPPLPVKKFPPKPTVLPPRLQVFKKPFPLKPKIFPPKPPLFKPSSIPKVLPLPVPIRKPYLRPVPIRKPNDHHVQFLHSHQHHDQDHHQFLYKNQNQNRQYLLKHFLLPSQKCFPHQFLFTNRNQNYRFSLSHSLHFQRYLHSIRGLARHYLRFLLCPRSLQSNSTTVWEMATIVIQPPLPPFSPHSN